MSGGAGRPVLVTGGAGFIGSNLAAQLAEEGYRVRVLDSLARPGVERNLEDLTRTHRGRIVPLIADLRDERAVAAAVEDVAAVFHFAAQVAVTTSMVAPREDFAVNLAGTLGLLEALRRQGRETPLIFASTNKVYGDLGDIGVGLREGRYQPLDPAIRRFGIDETRRLDFHTPYGCSKGAADQYVLDYARSFGLPTVVLRMSCIYGPRQLGTEDQGWLAHFLLRARAGAPITIFGDGRQVRDVLEVGDAVAAYLAAWRQIDKVAGRAFNLGGGPANAISLRDLLDELAVLTGRAPSVAFEAWRPGDQRWFVADARQLRGRLSLPAPRPWREGLGALAAWYEREGFPSAEAA